MTDSAFYRLQGEIWLISISLICGMSGVYSGVHTFRQRAHNAGGVWAAGIAPWPPALSWPASPRAIRHRPRLKKYSQVHCPGSKNVNWSGHDSIDNASFLSSGLISSGGTVMRPGGSCLFEPQAARTGQDTDYNAPLTSPPPHAPPCDHRENGRCSCERPLFGVLHR